MNKNDIENIKRDGALVALGDITQSKLQAIQSLARLDRQDFEKIAKQRMNEIRKICTEVDLLTDEIMKEQAKRETKPTAVNPR